MHVYSSGAWEAKREETKRDVHGLESRTICLSSPLLSRLLRQHRTTYKTTESLLSDRSRASHKLPTIRVLCGCAKLAAAPLIFYLAWPHPPRAPPRLSSLWSELLRGGGDITKSSKAMHVVLLHGRSPCHATYNIIILQGRGKGGEGQRAEARVVLNFSHQPHV